MGRGASTNSIPEIENARFLLVIGSNTTEAHPVLALRMKKAVRNGATLVVCDPRKIWLTKIAKRHLQLRPGSDVWLINAMLHVIFEEGLQDDAYIAEHTVGVDDVREIVARYTPEEAAEVTGVPAEDIRATAREYATERHAAVFYKSEGPGVIDTILAQKGLTRELAVLAPHFASVPFIVAESDLIATVPRRLALRFSKALKLQVLQIPFTMPPFRLAMLWHERVDSDPAHAWLRGLVAETAGSLAR